jgi:hypothetical protein
MFETMLDRVASLRFLYSGPHANAYYPRLPEQQPFPSMGAGLRRGGYRKWNITDNRQRLGGLL